MKYIKVFDQLSSSLVRRIYYFIISYSVKCLLVYVWTTKKNILFVSLIGITMALHTFWYLSRYRPKVMMCAGGVHGSMEISLASLFFLVSALYHVILRCTSIVHMELFENPKNSLFNSSTYCSSTKFTICTTRMSADASCSL